MTLLWQNYKQDDARERGAPPNCGGTDNGHPEQCPTTKAKAAADDSFVESVTRKVMKSRDPIGCGECGCRAVHSKGTAAAVGFDVP